MINPMAYGISFLTGFLIIRLLPSVSPCLNPFLTAGLSILFGLGTSSHLTFFTFLVFDKFNPLAINGLNLAVLFSLLLLNYSRGQRYENKKPQCVSPLNINHWDKLSLILFALGSIITAFIGSKHHPFGEWDAWALWNLKTKFLILGSDSWRVIFDKLHWHTQPDYPLLLPFMNVWVHAFTGETVQTIAFSTAVLLAVTSSLLLYGGLGQLAHRGMALAASAPLLLHPYYIFLATAQYADILLASCLLASLVLMILTLRQPSKGMAILTGLSLGWMTFTKNEGIVIAILILGLTASYLLFQKTFDKKSALRLIGFLVLGTILTALPTIIFKLFLAPPNRDILLNYSSKELSFLNLHGLQLIWEACWKEFTHERWCHIWFFIFMMVILGRKKFLLQEAKVLSFFFIAYALIVFGIYLTTANFDLAWRLKSTLSRILFYILPSLLFTCFYAHWRLKETAPSVKKINKKNK